MSERDSESTFKSSKERNAAGFCDIGPLVIDGTTFAEFEDGKLHRSYLKYTGQAWTNSVWLTPDSARALRDWLTRALGESQIETPAPQAAIALLTINAAGEPAGVTVYAPGLPPGEHELYCDPSAPAVKTPVTQCVVCDGNPPADVPCTGCGRQS